MASGDNGGEALFWRFAHDGEVHRDVLPQALQHAGVASPVQAWIDAVFEGMTKYTTLDQEEFVQFIAAYQEKQDEEYAAAFRRCDADGSGSIQASELSTLLEQLGVEPMDHVVAEVLKEVDDDNSGELSLQEFGRVIALLGVREGFDRREFERLMAAFRTFDLDGSRALDVRQLSNVLGYLHYSVSPQGARSLAQEVDVDASGSLNAREFLLFMRKVRELEVERLRSALARLEEAGGAGSRELLLFGLLRGLGYFPCREAVLEAAQDAGLELAAPWQTPESAFLVSLEKSATADKIGLTVDRAALAAGEALRVAATDAGPVKEWNSANADRQLLPGDVVLKVNGARQGPMQLLEAIGQNRSVELLVTRRGSTTPARGSPLCLGEAWRFLEAYRGREGLTRAEVADLEEVFHQHAERVEAADCWEMGTGSVGRALRWMGHQSSCQAEEQLVAEVDIDGSGRLNIAQFQKLVRKFHERELDDIRGTLVRLGLWSDGPQWLSQEEHADALLALGCLEEGSGKVAPASSGIDLFGLVQTALRHRREVRSTFRLNAGFGPKEVRDFRRAFEEVGHDGGIGHEELRSFCEELFPELAASMRSRPELVALACKSSDGRLGFGDFLQLMREFSEIRKQDRRVKEVQAVRSADFSPAQVREFREVFVAADTEERDCLSFAQVRQLLQRITPLGDKRLEELARVWQRVVMPGGPKRSPWETDFADFLLLMKRLLDVNFAGIRDWGPGRPAG